MSDCSTRESEPKKLYGLNECADCEHYCSYCGTCCENVPDHQDCMMPCFVPSRAVMLAEVARDMWRYVVAHNTPDVPGIDMTEFGDRLEALGVSLDD